MSVTAPQVKYITATVVFNNLSPFNQGERINANSVAGTTMYGANHPGSGSTTKYQSFKQTILGNKAFTLGSGITAPQQTSGAVTAANQLRTVVLLNGVPVKHTDDSLVAAASSFCIGVGGGTAIGEAVVIKGTTAANLLAGSALMSIARGDAGTQTILVGDILTIAGDPTVYRATATTASLNGTTEVNLAITPPLQQAVLAGAVVTIATSDDRTILFATAPAVGSTIEAWVLDAGDIETMTGGAMTAGREYDIECKSVFYSAGNVSISAF